MSNDISYISGNIKDVIDDLYEAFKAGELSCPICGGKPCDVFSVRPTDQFAAGAPHGMSRVLFFSFCEECLKSADLVGFVNSAIDSCSCINKSGECVQ